ncbi:Aspartate carbamoyltransferase [hydrothermal vent metagenome]|uniref:aspartate carbamoyltransferase n=1 Tax=hydrothermal vent metagenome TaxID=652676 RepID=A0A1W1CS61_9ZZZZ
MNHLLDIKSLNTNQIVEILEKAQQLIDDKGKLKTNLDLKQKTVANLFFEPSTRTRNTFEIAAQKLGARVINVDIKNSATNKGETLLDTMNNLKAMQVDAFVVRHKENNTPHLIAKKVEGVSVLNAGDGTNEHPTQALLDMLTIYQCKKSFKDLTVAIVGDILHSRVAHSDVQALQKLGVKDIRIIAPKNLQTKFNGVNTFEDIDKGLNKADVVIMLRLQKERMIEANIPDEKTYFKDFGLNQERLFLAKKDAIIMHPGPINRGVEISSDVADGKQSVILQQVTNGIAVRMAVLSMLLKDK